ncbi:helix-turn-helix domain-containing protein [Streptomyces venezuelae]|uniref:helix-turn-helix domain-containing protein n=1 Tax=Streptomyces venezuelae TaxID=54571 RepID=UPI00342640A8
MAALAGMSVDYYGRIEQRRGPVPSERMLDALARALRRNQGERDHLFVLGVRRRGGSCGRRTVTSARR